MTETPSNITPGQESDAEIKLQECLDALARGECTEDEFLSEIADSCVSGENSPWIVLALIDQRYRRGQLPDSLFLSIRSRIEHLSVDDRHNGDTIEIELDPLSLATGPLVGEEADITLSIAPPDTPLEQHDEQAQMASEAPVAPIHRILRNRYTIESLIGRGGMGDVFKASDGDGYVAVKILRGRAAERPEHLIDLRREFHCAQKLSHPNIVKVYELDHDGDTAFYTMELLEGQRLCDLIDREDKPSLPRPYAWAIIRAVGAALAHAHSRNVIHGDLTPRNVMITRGGEVRVLDFGSSRMSQHQEPQAESADGTSAVAATPAYASCELLEGHPADKRDDLYALACLAYELLSGEHPFGRRRSTEARNLGMRPRRPSGLRSSQWRALERGLSWTHAIRSIPIRKWLAELGLEPEPELLPTLDEPRELKARQWQNRVLAYSTVSSSIVVCAFVAWLLFRHPAGNTAIVASTSVRHEQPVPTEISDTAEVNPTPPPSTIPPLAQTLPSDAGNAYRMLTASPSASASAVAVASASSHAQPSIPVRNRIAAAAPPAKARSNIRFTANHYSISPSAHFAEIRLWRGRISSDTNSFVWWTKDSSAKAGTDFVPQDPTSHAFAQGRQSTTLFIRLVPNAVRTRRESFDVCIGKPGVRSTPDDVACSAVLLPTYTG